MYQIVMQTKDGLSYWDLSGVSEILGLLKFARLCDIIINMVCKRENTKNIKSFAYTQLVEFPDSVQIVDDGQGSNATKIEHWSAPLEMAKKWGKKDFSL